MTHQMCPSGVVVDLGGRFAGLATMRESVSKIDVLEGTIELPVTVLSQ